MAKRKKYRYKMKNVLFFRHKIKIRINPLAVKISYLVILFLLFLVTLVQKNAFHTADYWGERLHPQYTLDAVDILSCDYSTNGIEVDDRGVFTSVTNDSRVYIYLDEFNIDEPVETISLELDLDETSLGELYLYSQGDNIAYSTQPEYHNGLNIIQVDSGKYEKIRFDITNKENTRFYIDNVTFNSTDIMSYRVQKQLLPYKIAFFCLFAILIIYILYSIVKMCFLKNCDKTLRFCAFFGTAAILSIIYALNPLNISKTIAKETVFSHSIPLNEFVINNQLKDFQVKGNTIKSLNTDPWITLDLDTYSLEYSDVKVIDVFVSDINKEETRGEIYHLQVDAEGMQNSDTIFIKKGDNRHYITHIMGDVPIIRLDLTTEKNVEMTINSIDINNIDSIFAMHKFYCVNIVSMLFIVIINLLLYRLATKMAVENKAITKAVIYKLILSGVITLFALHIVADVPLSIASFILLVIFNMGYLYGFNRKISQNSLELICMSLLFLGIFLGILYAMPVYGLLGGFIAVFMYGYLRDSKPYYRRVSLEALALALVTVMTVFFNKRIFYSVLKFSDQRTSVVCCFVLLFSFIIAYEAIGLSGVKKAKTKSTSIVNLQLLAFLIYAIGYFIVFAYYNYRQGDSDVWLYFSDYMWGHNFLLNGIILMFICTALYALGGKRFTLTVLSIGLFVFGMGNYIKLNYQGTYLKLSDFLLLEDLFRILKSYIGDEWVISLCVVCGLLVFILIFKIKSVIKWFNFHTDKSVIGTALILVAAIITNNSGCFRNLSSENFKLYPPEGYSKSLMEGIIVNFPENTDDDIQPDVILIMGESVMDISKLPQINTSMDCTENIRKHQLCDIISPKYGGGTAAVEMEALTGFTNYFFVQDMVGYNFYFSKNQPVNSLASEFKRNGYETTALHYNRGSFYNRTMVYEDMGFDTFYNLDNITVPKDAVMNDDFTRDYPFFNKIKEELDTSAQPQFIFGVTIEGHSPYTNKFDNTDVSVDSPLLDDSEINETQQYFQTIKDIDDELGKLIEYLEKRQRPTLLYFWGDHLPPLNIYSKIGYFNGESYEKYTTPFVAYSNYKELSVEQEKMSPNQIACQLLRDSGIDYSRYFDYIYSLRENYPVIHKQLTPDLEGLDNYYAVIYDVLKGKNYIVEK